MNQQSEEQLQPIPEPLYKQLADKWHEYRVKNGYQDTGDVIGISVGLFCAELLAQERQQAYEEGRKAGMVDMLKQSLLTRWIDSDYVIEAKKLLAQLTHEQQDHEQTNE
jgi:hypothetical protein